MAPVTFMLRIDTAHMRLMRRAVRTLAKFDMTESLEAIDQRMVHSTGRPFMRGEATPNGMLMKLDPYAELALIDIAEIAKSTGSDKTKTARIDQILTLAGF